MTSSRPYMAKAKHPHHLTPSFIASGTRVLFGGDADTDPCAHPKSKIRGQRLNIVHPEHSDLVVERCHDDKSVVVGDGLVLPWWGSVFKNCPYGRVIEKWTERAVRHDEGPVLGLLPAKTSTGWWRRHVRLARAVVFLSGRLQFGDGELEDPYATTVVRDGKTVPRNQAPFPSALVLWDCSWRGLDAEDMDAAFGAFGDVWYPYQT